jgi:glutathione S-transferase
MAAPARVSGRPYATITAPARHLQAACETEPVAEIELVWFPGTCSRVTLIALEEIGVPFTTRLSPLARSSDPEFLALNPKGKVPVLLIDGVALTETPAILTHLARLHPGAALLPSGDELIELDALATMSWLAGAIHPTITRLRYPLRFCDLPGSAERTKQLAAQSLRGSFELLERRLEGRDWLYERWSAVDAYLLWAWFRAVGSGMDAGGLRRCAAHARRCEERPSVARALEREEQTLAEMLRTGVVSTEQLPPHQVGKAPLAA